MAGRRNSRVFLPFIVDEFLVSWNSGTRSIESNSLARAVDLAVRGARYETSSYVRRAWRGAGGRVPFVVPHEAPQLIPLLTPDGAGAELSSTGTRRGINRGIGSISFLVTQLVTQLVILDVCIGGGWRHAL